MGAGGGQKPALLSCQHATLWRRARHAPSRKQARAGAQPWFLPAWHAGWHGRPPTDLQPNHGRAATRHACANHALMWAKPRPPPHLAHRAVADLGALVVLGDLNVQARHAQAVAGGGAAGLQASGQARSQASKG